MIMGESFEASDIDGDPPSDPEAGGASLGGTWPNKRVAAGAVGSASIVKSERQAFHGLQAQQLTLASGAHVGVANRGLGNEGMVFKAGRLYEGYVWATAVSGRGQNHGVTVEAAPAIGGNEPLLQ